MPQAGIRTAQADGMRAWIPAMCTVQLASTLGLENTGSGYQKISNGNVEYTISGLSVELSNNALSSGQSKAIPPQWRSA